MCGIAAIFNYATGEPIDRDELIRIRDSMAARGPDGFGEWVSPDRRTALGHRRLSIIDLSPAGAQPMQSADGSLSIVFNGEIYNYRQLRAELESRGCVFRSQSDTEVLLHLYAEQGEAMLSRLRGMFAFALWDERRKGLFLARDPYGIKPLYFADDSRTLRAASQVKALLAGGKVDTSPCPPGHVGFFLWGHVPEPHTLYRGVRALPAGSWLWVGPDGARRERTFCSIPQIFADAETARPTSEPQPGARQPDPADTLRSALHDTVRHHLVADVPVGVFLSSGLDSTSLASLTAQQGGQLRTVTLGFEEFKGKPNDETPLAETVARELGAAHQTVWITRQDFQAHRDRLLTAMDQPSIDGVNTYFVSLATRRAGLKVALSGLGGDELFAGYPSFVQIPRLVRSLAPMRHLPWLGTAFRVITHPFLRRTTSPKYAGLLEYGATFPGAYLLRRGLFMPWELPEILDPDLVRQGWGELRPLHRLSQTVAPVSSPRAKVSCLEACWYMRNQLLRDSDWAGMAHSLEIRVPLVDTALLRTLAPWLASPTPPAKQQMAAVAFPPQNPALRALLQRPKTGFTIPVRDWLLDSVPPAPRSPANERGLRAWARHIYARFRQN